MKGNFLDTTADIVDETQGSESLSPPRPQPCPIPHLPTPPHLTLANACATQIDMVVARIDRKILSGKDIFFGQQTYGVQVAPGVDLALIAALCICLDEKNNEK